MPEAHPPDQTTTRIVGSSGGRVRKLSGFRTGHRVPDGHHDAAEAFVRRIGGDAVKELADGIHRDLREAFAYKRREMDYACGEGRARIGTPHFEVVVAIGQDPDDFKSYRLETSVSGLCDAELVRDARFHACFDPHCDTLELLFPGTVDLEAKIDRIEDIPELAGTLDYAPDGSRLTLNLTGIDLHIAVDSESLRLRLIGFRNLGKLLAHSQRALELLTAAGLGARLC